MPKIAALVHRVSVPRRTESAPDRYISMPFMKSVAVPRRKGRGSLTVRSARISHDNPQKRNVPMIERTKGSQPGFDELVKHYGSELRAMAFLAVVNDRLKKVGVHKPDRDSVLLMVLRECGR